MSEAIQSEYKGKPVLQLSQGPDDKYPFTFGLKKAKLIVEHINDIGEFINKHDKGEN